MPFRLTALFCLVWLAIHANENEIMGVGPAPIDLLIQVSDDFLKEHILYKKGGGSHFSPEEEGALKLQELCPVAVVPLGNKGCLVGYGKKVLFVPGFEANVIDTTGAGDYFAAGFLHGYLQGKSMEVAAKIGYRLGSAIVEVIGAQLPESKWESTRAAVQKYL